MLAVRGGDDPLLEGRGEGRADTLLGSVGWDFLFGGSGADKIDGGDGADTIIGVHDATVHDMGGCAAEDDHEADKMDAGAGDDLVIAGAGDIIRLGAGSDEIALNSDGSPQGSGFASIVFEDFAPEENLIELHVPAPGGGSTDFAGYVASRESTDAGTTIMLKSGHTLVFQADIPDDAFVIVQSALAA